MSRTKEVKVALGITVNPKQYHAFRVDVEAVEEFDETDHAMSVDLTDVVARVRERLSEALVRGINEEVTKFYGAVTAKAMTLAYGFEEGVAK